MKYGLILDENNYLNGFCHYGDSRDIVEIPNDVKTSNQLTCWMYENGVFTFDEEKASAEEKARKEEKEHHIKVDEQTLRLAELFVQNGVNADDFMDRIDAQMLYTALMTDTLLEEDEVDE